MTVNGIDVSAHQLRTPSLSTAGFLIARATYGTHPDAMYREHVAAARLAGLTVGAYHFGTSATSGRTQAAAFLAVASAADLLFLDLEAERGKVPMSLTQARAFIGAVRATGRPVGLYHSESGFPTLGQSFDWVANWSRPPARHWSFWQYRGSPLDLDRFAGGMVELRALAGRPATALYRVHLRPGTYRTGRVSGGRFLGYGTPFTTGGMSAWAGRPVRLRNGRVVTTWFQLRSGARRGTWLYRYDARLGWTR